MTSTNNNPRLAGGFKTVSDLVIGGCSCSLFVFSVLIRCGDLIVFARCLFFCWL